MPTLEQAQKQQTQGSRGSDEKDLCLLSLDGGGVRGLSSLFILKTLMTKLNAAREERNEARVKPCQVFDLIGGTSTGGLIAILLGRLELDVTECIEIYQNILERVFGKKEHKIPIKLTTGEIQNCFSAEPLKEEIFKLLDRKGIARDEMFENGVTRISRTFVVARRVESAAPVIVHDYSKKGEENYDPATIVQAALATSAASTFFPPVKIGNREYVDGALGSNNPISRVWSEAHEVWAPGGNIKQRLKVIVSIGTGVPDMEGIEKSAWKFMTQTLRRLVAQTEETANDFESHHRDLINTQLDPQKRHFRFNVEHGLAGVGLDEYKKVNIIESATFDYLTQKQERKFELENCGRWLSTKETRSSLVEDPLVFRLLPSKQTQIEYDECIASLQTHPSNKLDATIDRSKSRRQNDAFKIEKAEEGTLQWLKEDEHLQKWTSQDRGLFWIRGKPGSGKSVTMKNIYDSYQESCDQGSIVIGYFFSKLSLPSENRFEGLLRVLLIRILRHRPALFRSIRHYYRSIVDYPVITESQESKLEWTEADLLNALELILQTKVPTLKVTLFIDALDECNLEDEQSLVELIHIMHQWCSTHYNIAMKGCISSRPNPSMVDPSIGKIESFLLEEKTAEDIAHYLESQIKKATIAIPPGKDWSTLYQSFIDKADGCWLWVTYVARVLIKKGSTYADLERDLNNVPQKLYPLFDSFLNAIPSQSVEEANKMLALAVAAEGELDVEDFRYAMALGSQKTLRSHLELEQQPDFVQNDFTMQVRIQEYCGNFLEVKMEDSNDDESLGRAKVEFYHSSVKDYLLQRSNCEDSKIFSYADLTNKGNDILARACLRYLEFPELTELIHELVNTGRIVTDRDGALKRAPFIHYCLKAAFSHSCKVIQQGGHMSVEVENFWTPSFFQTWFELKIWFSSLDQPLGNDTTLTTFSIVEGADLFVKHQIERGLVNINETLTNFGHYLTLAAFEGQLKIVEMLLDLDDPFVDVDAPGGMFCTPLQASASMGHVDIVRLLLDKGANPHITGGKFMTPLCAAAFSLNTDVVELLLTHPRCDPAIFHNQWQNAKVLQFADEAIRINMEVSGGIKNSFSVIRLLAEHQFQSSYFEYLEMPLVVTLISVGHTEVMRMLIRDERFVDTPNQQGYTLLSVACVRGAIDSVKLLVEKLIEKKSSLNDIDRERRSALHFAAMNQSPEILDYLLDQTYEKLDPNSRDTSGLTALHVAYAVGTKKHVDLLLRAGASTEIMGTEQMTSLHFACLNDRSLDHIEVLEKFRSTNTNDLDFWKRSPLHIAAQYGSYDTVSWLLNNGAEVNAVDDEGRTAMHAACQNFTGQSTKIIDLLLEQGLSLSSKDFGRSTPMHLAFHAPKWPAKNLCWEPYLWSAYDDFSENKCLDTVLHTLGKAGIDLDDTDGVGNTPLHLACWRGLTPAIVEMVEKGANLDAKDSIGSVPIDLISDDETRDVSRSLLPLLQEIANVRGASNIAQQDGTANAVKAHQQLAILESGNHIDPANHEESKLHSEDGNESNQGGAEVSSTVLKREYHGDARSEANLLHWYPGSFESLLDRYKELIWM